jgi:3-hydroxyisobutyrate dehydrogenase-like beta-hydroxyacid dehydrogenase
MQVGFIGLGTMGGKMAANLQRAGYPLMVYDVRREAAAPHLAAGAVWADSPRQVAQNCEVVFSSLPGPSDVEEVALGEDGVLGGMRPGGAFFDLSTNSPTVVRRINAAFAERGVHMLDAPASGGPRGAATGKLAIWVGGEQRIFDQYKPVLARTRSGSTRRRTGRGWMRIVSSSLSYRWPRRRAIALFT